MPEGLVYQQDFLGAEEEQALLSGIRDPLRERIAGLVDVEAPAFQHALINEYRPGTELGWHRDAGEFGIVVGVSLGGTCRMRLRRYPPRKGWQHSVARTEELRYSITFRTRR